MDGGANELRIKNAKLRIGDRGCVDVTGYCFDMRRGMLDRHIDLT